MTLTSRALGLSLAAALTLSGSGLVAGPAQAEGRAQAEQAGRSYGTVQRFDEAELKACRLPIRQGRAFRIYAFLDNTAGARRGEVSAGMTVTKRGTSTTESFETGFIKGGKRSPVYDLAVPRRKAFQLQLFVAGRQSGGGGSLPLGSINRC